MSSTFYITTPIYYVNASPHIGHAYTTILADAIQRLHYLLGEDTWFLTGTDEHGEKIVQAAEKTQTSPQTFVDTFSKKFQKLWTELNVKNDQFVRTTNPTHKQCVQKFLQHIYDAGDIYFGEFGGYYCTGCERFYTEKELEHGLCPQHQTSPQFIQEQNYFFRMKKYLPWLTEYIHKNPSFIRPERYRNEVLSMLEHGVLDDLCISRPKKRLTWGIELPFDKNYVCYVWFDALLNYISALDWPEGTNFQKFWPGEHIIAKDILKPHGIFWPIILKSAGLPIYKHLNVHGYWLARDTKISKSLNNTISPSKLIEQYGLDAIRYVLLKEMQFGSDASFSEKSIITCINSYLANDLGNLFSRTLSMAHKYVESTLPEITTFTHDDTQLKNIAEKALYAYIDLLSSMRVSQGIEALWTLVQALNKYIDTQAPWKLFKEKNTARIATILRLVLECLRKIAIAIWPIMPDTAIIMLTQLGVDVPSSKKFGSAPHVQFDQDITKWDMLKIGNKLSYNSNLFPRLENKTTMSKQESAQPQNNKQQFLDIKDFQKIDLCTGIILEASKHPDADNLLCFKVDIGEPEPRQILSGIAQYFTPESMVGKQVCVVTNLEPKKIRGIVSQGMLLFANHIHGLSPVTIENLIPAGSKIS